MPIMCSRTTRARDMFPGPARDSYILRKCTIPEEQAQRCTFGLERVGAFALGEWIQLCQVLDLVDGPGPAHKTHNMGLIDRPRFKRVNASGGECPGGFAGSLRNLFCFAATVLNRHHPLQAINGFFDNALLMC